MINQNIQTILILAPHTDDGELGCGGSISKFIQEGKKVIYAAFSSCQDSLPSHLDPNTLKYELQTATKILGIDPNHVHIFNFNVRTFSQERQQILDQMIFLRNMYQPDLVFLPCSTDVHQDHATIHNEGVRAFKQTSILGYEMPWNNMSLETSCFIKLKDEHIQLKITALYAYESQKHRTYLNDNFVKSLASIRGLQIGTTFAEAFECIRWIM